MIEMTDSQALHRTVLLTEAADEVSRAHNGIFIDATFGRGGHSRAVLSRIAPDARLIAFDRDPEAIRAAAAIDDPRFLIVHAPFSEMKEKLAELGVTQVNGILMDIGVSSPQIDEADRGFSFRMDGPLDMRMDTTCGLTAAQWLAQASESDITRVLRDYGEERFAGKIARAICRTREETPIERTAQLADLIARTVPKNKNDSAQHPATRSFHAIRIPVHGERAARKAAPCQAQLSGHPHCRERRAGRASADARRGGEKSETGRTARGHHVPLARRPHRQALLGCRCAPGQSRRLPNCLAGGCLCAGALDRFAAHQALSRRVRSQSARPQRRFAYGATHWGSLERARAGRR